MSFFRWLPLCFFLFTCVKKDLPNQNRWMCHTMKRENKKIAPTIPASIPNSSNKIDEVSSIEPDASMLIQIPYSLDELIAIVNLPWNLAISILLGLSLILTSITLGHEGNMANWDHLIGSLIRCNSRWHLILQ